jgi:hypothetical protein
MGDNTENKLSDSIVRDAPNDIPISMIKVSFFVVCIGFFLFDLILVFYLIFLVFLIIFVVLIILIRVTIRVLLLRLVPMIDYVFFGASLNPFLALVGISPVSVWWCCSPSTPVSTESPACSEFKHSYKCSGHRTIRASLQPQEMIAALDMAASIKRPPQWKTWWSK